MKADERRKAGVRQNSAEGKGETREIVAEKSGFGSRDTYSKAKFIGESADPELINKSLGMGKILPMVKGKTLCSTEHRVRDDRPQGSKGKTRDNAFPQLI